MFTFLKTLFKKKPASAPAAVVASSLPVPPERAAVAPEVPPHAESAAAGPQVAVARLSLLAILQKLPPDLQPNISKFPDESVTVALPLTTIQKQLAAGSVKMSLASLYRQSPPGTFKSARFEEKRMIEVPLSEAVKHVKPQAFRRRADQRRVDLPSNAPQIFGDRANPYVMSPSEGEPEKPANGTHANGHAEEEIPPVEGMTAPPYTLPMGMKRAPLSMPKPVEIAPSAPPEAPSIQGEVSLPLERLFIAWPEPVRAEAAALRDSMLVIPAALLAPGMAKGKVAFSWGQIRGWITPAPSGETQAREATELQLPLKVVAPAFIAHTREQAAPRKEIDLDETIPGLFDGGEAARSVTPAAAEEPPAGLPSFRLATGAPPAVEPEIEATIAIELPPPIEVAAPAAAETLSLNLDPVAAPEPAPFGPAAHKHWSPQAMIDSIVALPGVAGAIVALREGLVVAAKLPEHMKGDTVAAFLPQIFARLNNYTNEMQLGQVEDLLLTVNGAHFQSYHMGDLYFAVLGKAGEALPWTELHVVVQELQKQTVA